MNVVNENKSQHRVTAGKVLATAGISCIPVITTTGDLLERTIKNHKVDKTPIKDCFVKAVKETGKNTQSLFSSLKNYSPLKVGIVAASLLTILDVGFTYWCVDKIAEKFKK